MENLGEEQGVLDLGYGEQGRVQSDTRKVGRGLYLEDSGEPWRNFKKERGVVTQSDLFTLRASWKMHAAGEEREVLE